MTVIHGTDGDDTLTGTTWSDEIHGFDGDDLLVQPLFDGEDTLDGGNGEDTVDYTGNPSRRTGDRLTIDLMSGKVSAPKLYSHQFDTLTAIEHAIGSDIYDHIIGSAAANRLDGGAGGDLLIGNGGDDTLLGGAGNDTLRGGTGADLLDGGDGVDLVDFSGSVAALTLDLAAGAVAGGTADGDTLTGIEGVIGTAFDDRLTGDAADNRVEGRAGADTMEGGAGADFLAYLGSDAAVTVNLAAGTVAGGHGEGDVFTNFEGVGGSAYDDRLTGDAGRNLINGALGQDTVSGGDGDDFLNGGGGDDTLSGGDGADEFYYHGYRGDRRNPDHGQDLILDFSDSEGDVLVFGLKAESRAFWLRQGHWRDSTGAPVGDPEVEEVMISFAPRRTILSDFIILEDGAGLDRIDMRIQSGEVFDLKSLGLTTGTAGNDSLTGYHSFRRYPDTMRGLGGDDTLDGGDGDDLLEGGAGDDVLFGGDGSDRLEGGDGDDLLNGGSSYRDTLNGGNGDDRLVVASDYRQTLDGGAGEDTVDYSGHTGYRALGMFSIDLAAGVVGRGVTDTLTSIEHAIGHQATDIITGTDAGNRLDGSGGHDLLIGNGGDDTLLGGAGNDSLRGGAGADQLDGGDGVDMADYSTSGAALTFDLAAGTFAGGDAEGDTFAGIEGAIGSVHDDRLTGDASENRFEGGAGADTLEGGEGTDFLSYRTSDAAVTVDLGAGSVAGGHGDGDVFTGFEGVGGSGFDDTLTGDDGDNIIGGAWGADVLSGGAGDDFLSGGWDDDTISGGDGADRFFHAGIGARDRLADRLHGTDLILDYDAAEGDVLVFGGKIVRIDRLEAEFVQRLDEDGTALGDDAIKEAVISFHWRDHHSSYWILVDGAAQDEIIVRDTAGHSFDLLA